MRATYLTQSGIRLLHDWGADLRRMFPAETAYLVGSALTRADYRDVDVRLMLDDHAIDLLSSVMNLADLNLAVSLWGQRVTGLPIDFQVQRATDANAEHDGRRHPLGRLADPSGSPGGGEPQPDTEMVPWHEIQGREHPTDGAFVGVRWGLPDHHGVCAITATGSVFEVADDWMVEVLTRPARSAGGGDQPDTPCPQCEGTGRVHPFPFMAPGDPTVPCPACTPSPEDGTDG